MADNDDDSPWLTLLGGLFCLWAAYYLHGAFAELESGARESIRVWWGIVFLYKNIGPGFTVFLVGVIGAMMTWSGVRRLFSS